MQQQAVTQILNLLPGQVCSFEGSEYPLPIKATFLGTKQISIPSLRRELLGKKEGDVKDLLEPLLLSAELCEAHQEDKGQFFLSDRKVQSYVFSGSKWQAGWALVLGGENQNELIAKLKEHSFMVFTDLANIPDTIYIGSRPTSPIYFLQLMVRYGLIWGHIAPGNDHQMSHFLEKDMPGLVIIYEDLPPLKYLITLGLMKLGAPAVVPSTFPFPYGRRVTADDVSDIIEKGSRFPNLRQRYYKDEIICLPDYCNPAFAEEKIKVARHLGGRSHSFFCVRPVAQAGQRISVIGKPAEDIGIVVEIAAENFSGDVALVVEKAALKAINFLPGVRAYEKNGSFHLELGTGIQLDAQQIGDAIYWGIRSQYPRLEQIAVRIIFAPDRLASEAREVLTYKKERQRSIRGMTEENTEEFCACTECRPFSLGHTCIITPERVPMCASRTYASIKAAAYFGSSTVPWKRQSEKELPIRHVFRKGKVLDPTRVENSGIVFLDELDKVAGRHEGKGPDVSREGVQRDILPIVEGTTVLTKYGMLRTDHVLFIAAGAFHMSKPSDLIPELQGRFPIRVELSSLTQKDFEEILLRPKNALIRQYIALLQTEGIGISFSAEAIREIAAMAFQVNEQAENIGARRLHTVMEKLVEDISYRAPEVPKKFKIDVNYVRERLANIVKNEDLTRYVL